MAVPLNYSAAGVSALEIELTPINALEPAWTGGFAIFACLDPYGRYNYTPRKLCLWEGILFSRCPTDRTNERKCVCNVLFP